MRNLSRCYSDHAVKVSDSYCSAFTSKSFHSPKPIPCTRDAVVLTYKVKISPKKHIFISIAWSTNLWVNVADKPGSVSAYPVRMVAEKGKEIFGACGSTVQVCWDLSSAKFNGTGPEPVSSFYVLVLIDSVPGLLLGDKGGDVALGLTGVKSSLVSHCEHVSGSSQFSTRGKFSELGRAHEIVIRCGPDVEGPNVVGPVLSISIDKKRVLRVTGLKWNFRGNQLVFVDGLTVDVMWDLNRWMNKEGLTVHDGGHDGVFMFRTRSALNSRLWLEEKNEEVEFCFLVCVTKRPL